MNSIIYLLLLNCPIKMYFYLRLFEMLFLKDGYILNAIYREQFI